MESTEMLDDFGCSNCKNLTVLSFDFTMAFQPILDAKTMRPIAFEALVRGTNGESASSVLEKIDDTNRYRFDQACRVKAIELASRLGLAKDSSCKLSINFLPNAIYNPSACIRATMEATKKFGLPHSRLIFEVTEGEKVSNSAHLKRIFDEYRRIGMITAIDDFGAGYSGLNLLVQFQPHIIKLDMELTRDIHLDNARQVVVEAIALACKKLNINIIAEGIETQGEAEFLSTIGINWHQGFYYAKPEIEALPLFK
ncbi:EAL domain-containing protein [Chromobacterium haemolyticum]|uniref:EAL domain-containing protein n=1 Tax=Chromobacterium haemolyticum TaxID=394935 RepID=UPI00307CCD68